MNIKSGEYRNCAHCNTSTYFAKHRLRKTSNPCCSLVCASRFSAKSRSEKLRKKLYPFVLGPCSYCTKDIIIKNSTFDKPNRKFCSHACKLSEQNRRTVFTEERRKKLSDNARLRFKGSKRTEESRKKLSQSISGHKHWNWQGGKTNENRKLRNSREYKEWRTLVYQRDNWTCQICFTRSSKSQPVILNADHIKSWAKHPDLRFRVDNGRTLCLECHIKTPTFGNKKI